MMNPKIFNISSIPLEPMNLTTEQQLKTFKVGDTVYVRKDAQLYTTDWNSIMNEYKGNFLIIKKIVTVEKSNYSRTGRYPNDDIIIHTDGNAGIDGHTWLWYYKSLVHPSLLHPNYKPRNIVR